MLKHWSGSTPSYNDSGQNFSSQEGKRPSEAWIIFEFALLRLWDFNQGYSLKTGVGYAYSDPEQTCFIIVYCSFLVTYAGCFMFCYSPEVPPTAEVLLYLDAHKAFDWTMYWYLFENFERFGFEPTFRSWIRVLYAIPQVFVNTNSFTYYFSICRGPW